MEVQSRDTMKKLLLLLNVILLAAGGCGGPLILRLYYIHGGSRLWLSTWLQSVGFPINLIPLTAAYIHRRKTQGSNATLFLMKPIMFFASIIIGLINGFAGYLVSFGVSKLPVSTSVLLLSTQLAFTAAFAFLLVKQKFTPYSINAVVLLIIGSSVLALDTSTDRPKGESNKEYALGFVTALLAAALVGLTMPLVELTYMKARQTISYTLVMEFQFALCFFATAFSTVGMIINHDFKVIPREAREFGLGEAKYYIIIVCSAILWQCNFLGLVGVIFCASSLFSGIICAALIPATQVLSVVLFHEKFQTEKIVSLVLSLWGSASYFYGEKKQYSEKEDQIPHSQTCENSSEIKMTLANTP